MVSRDGPAEVPQDGAGSPPSVPAMPSVPPAELHRGYPHLLLGSGFRHSLGWQEGRKAGPSFVVARLSRMDTVKVIERFPLTNEGWASAWLALSGLDPRAAAATSAKLAQRAERFRAVAALAALDNESLRILRHVIFNGGGGEVPLTKGQAYDLRFGDDRIMVCRPGVADAVAEVPYRDVEAVEVTGPERSGTGGPQVGWILALGLLGALLGLLIFGLVGLLLGALIFGAIGAAVGSASDKIETVVRIRGRDAEFYFLSTAKRPDALRIELSEPLRAIGRARAAPASDRREPPQPDAESVPDQLNRLASLLEQNLISRDEFELLKAKLIPKS